MTNHYVSQPGKHMTTTHQSTMSTFTSLYPQCHHSLNKGEEPQESGSNSQQRRHAASVATIGIALANTFQSTRSTLPHSWCTVRKSTTVVSAMYPKRRVLVQCIQRTGCECNVSQHDGCEWVVCCPLVGDIVIK
jgi:hypothetical protein